MNALNGYVTALIEARFKLRQQEAAAGGGGGAAPARRQDILDQTMGAIDPAAWSRASVEQIRDEVYALGFKHASTHPHTHTRSITHTPSRPTLPPTCSLGEDIHSGGPRDICEHADMVPVRGDAE